MTRRTFLMKSAAIAVGAFAAGCGEAQTPAPAPAPGGASAKAPAGGAKRRVLVAYYSWGGNTKALAGHLAAATGGDLFAITPKTAYPTDYNACVEQAKKEIAAKARPALAAWPDFAKYDVVLVGTPNWWGTLAPPVSTFVENEGLAGKAVALFQTHGGGGAQRCERDFKAQCKGTPAGRALIISGSRAARSGEAAAEWARSLGL